MNALVSTYALGWFELVASYVVLAALLLPAHSGAEGAPAPLPIA